MNFKSHISILRVQVLSMARLSQRALDSSIKGYELGSLEFCRDVSRMEGQIDEHHCQIRYLSRKLIGLGRGRGADSRFALASLRVSGTLRAIYGAAAQMAHDTVLFVESGRAAESEPMGRLGMLANALMRLCVVALFEKEAKHAEMVLQSQGVWRRCELIIDELGCSQGHLGTEDSYALRIAQSLGTVARRAHEMADAIAFWLRARNSTAALEAYGQDALNFLLAAHDTAVNAKTLAAMGCPPAA